MGGTDAVCVRGLVVVAADIDFAFFAFPFDPVDFVAIVANLVCEIGVETAVANVAEASRIRLVDIERRARMFNTDASRGQASQAPFRRLAQLIARCQQKIDRWETVEKRNQEKARIEAEEAAEASPRPGRGQSRSGQGGRTRSENQ